jgi:GR25 family glycosyltransferase involved in LPS biosynthesis
MFINPVSIFFLATISYPLLPPPPVECYVVNLQRSITRKKLMEDQGKKIPGIRLNFVEAVDGTLLEKHPYLRAGELGIYFTTLKKILPLALENRTTTVFEDDVLLPSKLAKDIHRLISSAPQDWDIIYLGCNENVYADAIGKVSPSYSKRFRYNLCPSSTLKKIDIVGLKKIESKHCMPGLWAYMLNPKGAELLLDILSLETPKQPIDVEILDLIDSGVIQAYCASPSLVKLNYKLESTIR